MEWTRNENYKAAQNLLHLLRKGYVKLWLGDDDWETESYLESIDCPVIYGRNGYSATFRM